MEPIMVEALLVQAPGERVRLILDPYCLEFELADVLEVEELPAPADLVQGSAIPARVTLKPGARVMRISPATAYAEVLWQRRLPFALATRPTLIFEAQADMKKREAAFFAARNLSDKLS